MYKYMCAIILEEVKAFAAFCNLKCSRYLCVPFGTEGLKSPVEGINKKHSVEVRRQFSHPVDGWEESKV